MLFACHGIGARDLLCVSHREMKACNWGLTSGTDPKTRLM